jgi:hypothetical protein
MELSFSPYLLIRPKNFPVLLKGYCHSPKELDTTRFVIRNYIFHKFVGEKNMFVQLKMKTVLFIDGCAHPPLWVIINSLGFPHPVPINPTCKKEASRYW